jgi:hypothetical protein
MGLSSRDDDKTGGDEKSDEERWIDGRGSGGGRYRDIHSRAACTLSHTSALETIIERNDEDVEMGQSYVSKSAHAREQSKQFPSHLQLEREQERMQRQQEHQQLQHAIQEELNRAEDKTSLMSDVTAGTLRSERHLSRSFQNIGLYDTKYM